MVRMRNNTFNIIRMVRLVFLGAVLFPALLNGQEQRPPETNAEKIIRAVEDTIGVDIEELSAGDVKRLEERALELRNVSIDEKLQSGGG